MFKVRITEGDDQYEIEWRDGRLFGPLDIAFTLYEYMREVSVQVPCWKEWEGEEILKSDLATWLTLNQFYPKVELVEGEIIEQVPPIPPGAVS